MAVGEQIAVVLAELAAELAAVLSGPVALEPTVTVASVDALAVVMAVQQSVGLGWVEQHG